MNDLFKRYGPNLEGNDFAVGDIHGEFSKLEEGLKKVGFDKTKDRLFCVGDLIDRGPESEQSYDFLYEPWVYSIRGNHEQFLIDYHESGNDQLLRVWTNNGGSWIFGTEWRLFYEKFKQLPYLMEVEVEGKKIGFAHGDLRPDEGVSWTKYEQVLMEENPKDPTLKIQLCESILWDRGIITEFKKSAYYAYMGMEFDHEKYTTKEVDWVFLGHTPTDDTPLVVGNHVFIDSGAVFRTNDFCIVNLNEWVKDNEI